MTKLFLMAAALSGALSVALGAFGAHGLRARVESGALEPRLLDVWHTAAQYQMYHALALCAVAWVITQHTAGGSNTPGVVAGWAFIVGTLLFSGSLYTMTLTGVRWLGAITPLGGAAMIVGWIALAIASYRLHPPH